MKKIQRLIITLMIGVTLLSAIACGKANDKGTTLPNGYESLFDFESTSELKNIQQYNYFGKYSINNDANYVKQGEGSLKLTPSGVGYGDDLPTLKMFPSWKDKKYSDFYKAERVTFDIYNTSSDVKTCYFSMTFASSGSELATKSKTYSLPGKSWTKCVYEIEYEKLAYIYDFKDMRFLSLIFDGIKIDAPKTEYYLDNVLVKHTESERKTAPIVLDKNEICNYEKDYQQYLMYITGFGAYTPYTPIMSVNTNEAYASNGTKSMRLDIPHGIANQSCYVRIMFCETLIEELKLVNYEKDYDIVFDLYNDSESTFYVEGSIREKMVDNKLSKRYLVSFTPTPKTWVECRIDLSAANEYNKGKEGEPSFVSQVASLEFCYGDFAGSSPEDNKTIYIDNFRLEKK